MNSICRVAVKFDTTYHMYDTKLQTAVCLTHTTFATVHGTPTHMSVYITVIRQGFDSTYQAGS